MIVEYVLGFAFSTDKSRVMLIKKTHPAWQAGKLNGIGGHVEDGEKFHQAMRREFEEETGVRCASWDYCLQLRDPGDHYIMRVYMTVLSDDKYEACSSMTEEKLVDTFIANIVPSQCVYNLRWIVPMLLDSVVFPVMMMYDDMPGDTGEKKKC